MAATCRLRTATRVRAAGRSLGRPAWPTSGPGCGNARRRWSILVTLSWATVTFLDEASMENTLGAQAKSPLVVGADQTELSWSPLRSRALMPPSWMAAARRRVRLRHRTARRRGTGRRPADYCRANGGSSPLLSSAVSRVACLAGW